MRILALTNNYPRPGHETVATFNRRQFRALAAAHDLRVIAPVLWTEGVIDWLKGRVAAWPCRNDDGIWVDYPFYYYTPKRLEHHYGQFYYHSVKHRVREVIEEFRPEIVLSCFAHPDGWATVRLAREAGLPVVIKVIGTDVLVNGRNQRRRPRIAEALREADGVVAVSRDLADHVIRLGAEPRNVRVVYEGVDGDLFRPGNRGEARMRLGLPAEGNVLLFVGSLLFSKGAGVLLQACALLRQRGLDLGCYLVGHGRDAGRLRALAGRLGLGDRVRLVGSRPQAQLPDWYRACDLVTLPSFSEGIPNVLREGLMCGRPFVATRVGGIPEIAHPSYSRLVAPGAVEELAAAVAELLAARPHVEPELARRYNITGEESARQLADCLRDAAARSLLAARPDRSPQLNGQPLPHDSGAPAGSR
jgi:glycosyltransferase involved in cell wall biosynthesis